MLRVLIPHHGSDYLLTRCMEAAQAACDGMDAMITFERSAGRLFTATSNALLRTAAPGDVAWLLNNDAVAHPLAAAAAMCMLDAHPQIGIVASQNRSIDAPDQATWAGSGNYFPCGRHKVGPVEMYTFSRELWAPFSSVFIRGTVLQQIGILDERMRHICSDADYCIRARQAGWQIWHCADSIVGHDFGSSVTASAEIEQVKLMDIEVFKRKHKMTIDGEHGIAK